MEEVIPNLVDTKMNNILTMLPSRDKIKKAVFNLNMSGAPGPDVFGGDFFQTYWDIISNDIGKAVVYCGKW